MTTQTTKTTPIQDELAQAQATYDSALKTLLKACADFNEGSGKQYAELMQRHADLRGKIAAHEAAAETATLEFKQLLAAANFEKTKAVKEALFKKNDALAIAEELREALTKAIADQKDGKTTLIEAMINQELGEPFRRDAMKKPVAVAGISAADMRPQRV